MLSVPTHLKPTKSASFHPTLPPQSPSSSAAQLTRAVSALLSYASPDVPPTPPPALLTCPGINKPVSLTQKLVLVKKDDIGDAFDLKVIY